MPKSAQAEKGRVRDELAKIAGVGHDTIEKVQVIEKSATPEEKQKLSKGKSKWYWRHDENRTTGHRKSMSMEWIRTRYGSEAVTSPAPDPLLA